jgi:hypothetical protein
MSDESRRSPARGVSLVSATSGRRKPRGYEGHRHETIGSDILAVRDALADLSRASTAEQIRSTCRNVLGAESSERVERVEPDRWYPIEWLLVMMESIDAKVGHNGLRRMGRLLFQRSHAARFSLERAPKRFMIFCLPCPHLLRQIFGSDWSMRTKLARDRSVS